MTWKKSNNNKNSNEIRKIINNSTMKSNDNT